MPTTTIKYFAFAHLPPHLQAVSKPIGELAEQFERQLADGPEKSTGMRKLLEAKDCFVRAALDAPKPDTATAAAVDNVRQRPLPGADLPPHQKRVIDEKRDLDERKQKLEAFFETPTFAQLDDSEQGRLHAQHAAMVDYSRVLGDRIEAFTSVVAA
jgi:hypothetical protein